MRLPAAALLACLAAPAAADPVVVELFTSQGCSSCPPADAMLGELAARPDVIALSLHVDYWDWIGWPDTFGDPAHSARQKGYAAAAGTSVVYTPQFVVGGRDHVAGADGMDLAERLRAHADAARGATVLEAEGDRLRLAATGRPARLTLVHVLPEATVPIERGENAGRTVTYHHVVAGLEDLGPWDGAAGTWDLPPARDGMVRVVLAQARTEAGHPGPVLGAAVAP